jgi:hypothetical protein
LIIFLSIINYTVLELYSFLQGVLQTRLTWRFPVSSLIRRVASRAPVVGEWTTMHSCPATISHACDWRFGCLLLPLSPCRSRQWKCASGYERGSVEDHRRACPNHSHDGLLLDTSAVGWGSTVGLVRGARTRAMPDVWYGVWTTAQQSGSPQITSSVCHPVGGLAVAPSSRALWSSGPARAKSLRATALVW